jgi:hypothetical protein
MPSPNVLNVQSRKFVRLAAAVSGGFGRSHQALHLKFLRQIAQVVLKRIGHPGIVALYDPALAYPLVNLFAQDCCRSAYRNKDSAKR